MAIAGEACQLAGMRGEGLGQVLVALQVRLAMTFLDTEFTDAAVSGQDLDGRHLPNAPEFSGTLDVDWDVLSIPAGTLALHVGGNYQSSQYFEPFNVGRIKQDGYGLLTARAAFTSADDAWEVGVWARNLDDTFYLTNAINVLDGFGYDYTHRGEPRTYGIDVAYRFE